MPKIKNKNNEEQEKENEQKQSEQIAEMLANPPSEEEGEEQPKGEQEEETQEPEGQEQEEQEEETEDNQEAEEESQEETIERLRNQLEKVSGGKKVASKSESEKEQDNEQEDRPKDPRGAREQPSKQEIQEEAEELDIEQIVSPEEFEEIQTDPKKFNQVLAKVYKAAEANARQKVMQDVPQLVQKTASRQATYQTAVQNFYDDNPDLKPFKKFVSVTMNEVAAENPDMNLEDMLQETAKRARKNLALASSAREQEEERREQEDQGPSDKPAFAEGSKGGRSNGGGDTRSNQQKQIDDLI